VSFFATENPTSNDAIQNRLMQLAAVFLLLFSLSLSLAPAARLHSWQAELRWNHWIGFVVWLIGSAVVHHQLVHWAPDRDPYLFPVAALLTGWGLLTIWRLDAVMGARQTAWLAICLIVFTAGLRIPNLMLFLHRYKYLWLTCGLLLTGLTFLFGTYPGGMGPRLWLGCCGVYLQPSEPLKLLLIVYLSAYLADRLPISFNLAQLLTPTIILFGAALTLLLIQRDLGTASLFILIYTTVVYISSRRARMLLISFLILLTAGIIGYLLFDVVRVRVDAWLNPWLDPSGRSYQWCNRSWLWLPVVYLAADLDWAAQVSSRFPIPILFLHRSVRRPGCWGLLHFWPYTPWLSAVVSAAPFLHRVITSATWRPGYLFTWLFKQFLSLAAIYACCR
jgi:hypothetical protein